MLEAVSCCGDVFQRQDWGTYESRRKALCTKILRLMKTQSRAFRTSDWAEGSPSNRTVTLSTQQEWLIHNAVNVLEWPSHSLGLEPNQIFLEKPENLRLPHPTWQSLRGEEVRRRMANNCQMLMSKACRTKQKSLEAVKVLQLNGMKVWIYLCNVLISVFFFYKFTKLRQFCFCFVNVVYMKSRLMWKKGI